MQPDPTQVPRYANLSTFARLPHQPEGEVDIGIVGVPFDGGCTYRTGARFGPSAIRQASRLLRAYNPEQGVYPFRDAHVADLGDVSCTPFCNAEAMEQLRERLAALCGRIRRMPVLLGGDHTISYPILKALSQRRHFPDGITLVHFDSHMDTWDDYFGEAFTHGTPFRRAFDEGLINTATSMHIGLRGSINHEDDIAADRALGFRTVRCAEVEELGVAGVVRRIRDRVRDTPCYLSIDIDVVDPGAAPGTGTPECGGLSPLQLLAMVRQLRGIRLVGADVVEVAPAYDVSEVTATLAATLAYEMICLGVSDSRL
jgi:agmatinase